MRYFAAVVLLVGALAPALCAAASDQERLAKLAPRDGAHPGWKRREAPRFFGRDDLFEQINGAANAYLERNFKASMTLDFLPGGQGKDFIAIDVFDMGDPANARAIYQKEAYKAKSASVGAKSYVGADHLHFWKGRYYVKLLATRTDAPFSAAMLALAKKIAAAIPGK